MKLYYLHKTPKKLFNSKSKYIYIYIYIYIYVLCLKDTKENPLMFLCCFLFIYLGVGNMIFVLF